MILESTIKNLIEDAMGYHDRNVRAQWYLFGSYLCESDRASDIDILVLSDDIILFQNIRTIIKSIDHVPPFHFTMMTPSEEEETKFLERQRCVQIFP
jgi:predicted nucleotidyltransferase